MIGWIELFMRNVKKTDTWRAFISANTRDNALNKTSM